MRKIFSNFAAAILTLTSITACDEGRIYPETTATTEREGLVMRLKGNIVGKPSLHVSGKNIVEPGNYEESTLALMLDTNLTATWGYDHQHADISDTWREILKKWIESIGQ